MSATSPRLFIAAAALVVAFQAPAATQNNNVGSADPGLTYLRGQSVVPIFGGWSKNPDGTFDMHFSYLNRNWQEELEIPIGPNNNVTPAPYGPDAGQPTHFLPRNNRWLFTVRVPADFGTREIAWTLTSHGQTHRAFGVLKPGYIIDDYSVQHEFGSDSTHGRKPPELQVEGAKQRTVKVGEPVTLAAVATDPNPARAGRGGPGGGRGGARGPTEIGPGSVGGDSIRTSVTGLRFAWFLYRGPAEAAASSQTATNVRFSPPMPFKVWEDQRGGSPWAPGWQPPPIPEGNRWVYNVTFQAPGTYVLRALAHNGSKFAYENVTFSVTP